MGTRVGTSVGGAVGRAVGSAVSILQLGVVTTSLYLHVWGSVTFAVISAEVGTLLIVIVVALSLPVGGLSGHPELGSPFGYSSEGWSMQPSLHFAASVLLFNCHLMHQSLHND